MLAALEEAVAILTLPGQCTTDQPNISEKIIKIEIVLRINFIIFMAQ